jgi:hypothetical protein
MTTQGEQLASQFEAANKQFISTVEAMSDADWKKTCPSEGWPAGVTAHHAAESTAGLAGMVQMLAQQGQLPAITQDQLNAGNAEHASRAANVGKAETLALARTNGEAAAKVLRSLSDEQLAKTAMLPLMGQEVSAKQLTEMVMIGHLTGHGASITAAR